jgi:hypothetical protein
MLKALIHLFEVRSSTLRQSHSKHAEQQSSLFDVSHLGTALPHHLLSCHARGIDGSCHASRIAENHSILMATTSLSPFAWAFAVKEDLDIPVVH